MADDCASVCGCATTGPATAKATANNANTILICIAAKPIQADYNGGIKSPLYTMSQPARRQLKTPLNIILPDGAKCHGVYYPGDTELVGIFVHGFRSSVVHTKARFFREHALTNGYSWAHFDLPCHGQSPGAFRSFRVSAALLALREVMRQLAGAPLLLLGSSLGGWLSIAAAREYLDEARNIAAAVLLAPAFDFIQHYFIDNPDITSQRQLRQWKLDGVRGFADHYDDLPYELEYGVVTDGVRHNLLENPGQFNFPVTIFHGDADDIVPLALSRKFTARAHVDGRVGGADLRVIAAGDHTLESHWPRITAELDAIFRRPPAARAR